MNSFADVSREKGKFRTFLLAALKHFLSDEWDRSRAEKRGGGQALISIDDAEAEERYLELPNPDPQPQKSFDRRWALAVMEQALVRIKQDYDSSGRQELFEHLSVFLSSEPIAGDYDALAGKLGTSSNGLAAAVYRLRQRFRECIRLELAQTVAGPQDLEEEMSYLFSILSE
jgi:RNA polymerase sigma-70 factor (ECF subfamily)